MVSPLQKGFSPEELGEFLKIRDIGPDWSRPIAGHRYRNVRIAEFEGKHYLVSKKAVLTVNLTATCNAACGFCYNGVTFFPYGRGTDDEQYLSALARTVAFAAAGGIAHVSYSGGEPTLHPDRLLAALDLTGCLAGFKRVHTNGSRLLRDTRSQGVLVEALRAHGATEVSISRAAADRAANSSIMRMRPEDSQEDAALKEIARCLQLRFSGYLHPEGVFDVDGLKRYVDWGVGVGARGFVFRLSSDIPKENSLTGPYASGNARMRHLTTDELCEALVRDGWSYAFRRREVDYDLHILRQGDVEVSIDRSSDVADPDRKIRRLIHMPNSLLYSSWLSGSSLVFDSDRPKLVKAAGKEIVGHKAAFPAAVARRTLGIRPLAPTHDMHVHSSASDGVLAPSEVIDALAKAGIRRAVFTEHNGVHPSWEALSAAAGSAGVDCPIPGAEVSANYVDPQARFAFRFHILVYGHGLLDPAFRKWVARASEAERQFVSDAHARLSETLKGLPSIEAIYHVNDSVPELSCFPTMMRRTPLANAVASASGCTIDEAKRLIGWLTPEVKNAQSLDAVAVVRRAHAAGCVTVLAHPGWIRNVPSTGNAGLAELMEAIVHVHSEGLDGIELWHRLNDEPTSTSLGQLARSLDMLVTGGSDFHGRPKDTLGIHGSHEAEFDAVLQKIDSKERRLALLRTELSAGGT